jgi:hypothetical protein
MPDTLPNISFTSKQLRNESVLVYLQRTRFVFDNIDRRITAATIKPLEEFLASFERGFESIRMLTFYEVAHFGSSMFTERTYPASLVSRCFGLRQLELEFRLAHILRFESMEDEFAHIAPRLLTQDKIRV